MDYEQKYKEALERARKLYRDAIILQLEQDIKDYETIFPELRESEDEKIRKALLELVHDTTGDELWVDYNVHKEDCLAWLEKQNSNIDNANKEYWRGYREGKQEILDKYANLERQGGQKSIVIIPKFRVGDEIKTTNEAPLTITKITDSGYWSEDLFICSFENSAKWELVEKLIDKVDPKFKVGDWIVGANSIYKITSLNDELSCYIAVTTRNEEVKIPYYFDCAQGHMCSYHLWTIQDAKDGDVLCTYECEEPKIVFILKGTPKKHYALSYNCYYNIMYPHFGSDSEKGCLAPNDEDVKPATKEQRDILFQKMKEAGYEWDSEKKELKLLITNGGDFESKNCEQKPAWSKEDEERIKNIISVLDVQVCWDGATGKKGNPYQKEIDWLKSLRPKNGWKPTDKDIFELQCVINNGPYNGFILKALLEQLKKLGKE